MLTCGRHTLDIDTHNEYMNNAHILYKYPQYILHTVQT